MNTYIHYLFERTIRYVFIFIFKSIINYIFVYTDDIISTKFSQFNIKLENEGLYSETIQGLQDETIKLNNEVKSVLPDEVLATHIKPLPETDFSDQDVEDIDNDEDEEESGVADAVVLGNSIEIGVIHDKDVYTTPK